MRVTKDPSFKELPDLLKLQGKTMEDWLTYYERIAEYFRSITGNHWRDWYEVAEENGYQLPSLWEYWYPHFSEADQDDMAFNCAEDASYFFGIHPHFMADEDYWESQGHRQYEIAKELALGI